MKMKNINRFKDWAIYGTKEGKKKIKFKGKIYDVVLKHYIKSGKFIEEVYFVDDKGVYYDLVPAIYHK